MTVWRWWGDRGVTGLFLSGPWVVKTVPVSGLVRHRGNTAHKMAESRMEMLSSSYSALDTRKPEVIAGRAVVLWGPTAEGRVG